MNPLFRSRIDDDIDEELRSHIQPELPYGGQLDILKELES